MQNQSLKEILQDISIHFPEEIVNHPAFLIQYDRRSEYSNFVFGTRSGPTNHFSYLIHEICHAVQFNDMIRSKYGFFQFKLPKSKTIRMHTGFHSYTESPKDDSATVREIETMAMASFFFDSQAEFKEESYKLLEWLYDYSNFKHAGGREKFDRLWKEYKAKWTKETIIEEFHIWLDRQYVNRCYRLTVGK
jgi:hypothetical protein